MIDYSLKGLIDKMEERGFNDIDVSFFLDFVFVLPDPLPLPFDLIRKFGHSLDINDDNFYYKFYKYRLIQYHLEMDFTGYKKNGKLPKFPRSYDENKREKKNGLPIFEENENYARPFTEG